MTDLDEARRLLDEYRATPASSTRRRCRLAVGLMDLIGEFRDRLINGAEMMITPGWGSIDYRQPWIDMLSIYRECQKEIDALGYTRNELQIAAACAIFDAVVEKE